MSDLSTLEFAPAVEKPRERVCLTPDDHAEILSNYARLNHSRWENHATLQGSKSGSSFASADSFGSRPTKVKGVPRFIPRTEVFEGGWKDDSYWDYAQSVCPREVGQSGGIESHLWGWPTEEARRQSFGGGSINPVKEPVGFVEAHLWTRTILNDLMPTPLTFILEDPKPLQNWVLKKRDFCEAYHDWFTRGPVMLEVFGVRNLEEYPAAWAWQHQKQTWIKNERRWVKPTSKMIEYEIPALPSRDDWYMRRGILFKSDDPDFETQLEILRSRVHIQLHSDANGPVTEPSNKPIPAACVLRDDWLSPAWGYFQGRWRTWEDWDDLFSYECTQGELDGWKKKWGRKNEMGETVFKYGQYEDHHFQKECWSRRVRARKDETLPAESNMRAIFADMIEEPYEPTKEEERGAAILTGQEIWNQDETRILTSFILRMAQMSVLRLRPEYWSEFKRLHESQSDDDSEKRMILGFTSSLPKCKHGSYIHGSEACRDTQKHKTSSCLWCDPIRPSFPLGSFISIRRLHRSIAGGSCLRFLEFATQEQFENLEIKRKTKGDDIRKRQRLVRAEYKKRLAAEIETATDLVKEVVANSGELKGLKVGKAGSNNSPGTGTEVIEISPVDHEGLNRFVARLRKLRPFQKGREQLLSLIEKEYQGVAWKVCAMAEGTPLQQWIEENVPEANKNARKKWSKEMDRKPTNLKSFWTAAAKGGWYVLVERSGRRYVMALKLRDRQDEDRAIEAFKNLYARSLGDTIRRDRRKGLEPADTKLRVEAEYRGSILMHLEPRKEPHATGVKGHYDLGSLSGAVILDEILQK